MDQKGKLQAEVVMAGFFASWKSAGVVGTREEGERGGVGRGGRTHNA